MNIAKLKHEIELDEGVSEEIYLDTLGNLTFGIGHLVISGDAEYNMTPGTKVSLERIMEAFNLDICETLNDCEILYPDFYELPEEVQRIIANMMFNLGLTKLTKFRSMKKAIDQRDWIKASYGMINSKWYAQVTNRAERLVARMRNIME